MHPRPMTASQLRPLSPLLQHQPGLGAPLVQQPQGQPRLQLQRHPGHVVLQPQQLLPRPQPRPPCNEIRALPLGPRAAPRRL